MHCTYRKFRGQKTNLCEIIGWHLNFFVNLMKWIYKGQMLTACSTTFVASFLKTKFPWWPTFMYVQKCLNWTVPFSTRSKDAPGQGSGWGPPLQHCGLWTGDTAQQVGAAAAVARWLPPWPQSISARSCHLNIAASYCADSTHLPSWKTGYCVHVLLGGFFWQDSIGWCSSVFSILFSQSSHSHSHLYLYLCNICRILLLIK